MPRALVVGASDGIGLAVARRLLADGWDVLSVSRRASPIAHERHHAKVLDVRDATYRAELAAFVDEPSPALLDVCIYCAGIGDVLDVETMQPEHDVFAVNLLGAVATGEVVLARMVKAGRGHFLALSSLADVLISDRTPSYAASKAGLSSWLSGMALAMKPRGVTVTNVRFGFVDTKMAKSPAKPFMMSVERAVRHVVRAIEKRPLRLSRPFAMVLLVSLLARLLRIRLFFAG
jgi:NAD(P)-dependent dehydrogenase (short-subunit alcohol dehydrogenase family)